MASKKKKARADERAEKARKKQGFMMLDGPPLSSLNQGEQAKAATQIAQEERIKKYDGVKRYGSLARAEASVFPIQWAPTDDPKINALIMSMFEAGRGNWYPDVDVRMLHLVDALYKRLRIVEAKLAKALNPALLGAE